MSNTSVEMRMREVHVQVKPFKRNLYSRSIFKLRAFMYIHVRLVMYVHMYVLNGVLKITKNDTFVSNTKQHITCILI